MFFGRAKAKVTSFTATVPRGLIAREAEVPCGSILDDLVLGDGFLAPRLIVAHQTALLNPCRPLRH
jgi:hypothetical protein